MGQSKPFRPTALVVEDDPIQREMIVRLLEENDYRVIQFEDAETAELALNRRPSLLITDVTLVGDMTGIELVERAREVNPALRVIVMSGQPLAKFTAEWRDLFRKTVLCDRTDPRGRYRPKTLRRALRRCLDAVTGYRSISQPARRR